MNDLEQTRINEILSLHAEIGGFCRMALDRAIRIGELLTEQKKALPHGQFIAWVGQNMPFTDRTARNYMRCHEQRDLVKTENVSDLAGAYRLLTEPKKSFELPPPETPEWIPSENEMVMGYYDDECFICLYREDNEWVQIYHIGRESEDRGCFLKGTKRGVRCDRASNLMRYMEIPSEVCLDGIQWKRVPIDSEARELNQYLHDFLTELD